MNGQKLLLTAVVSHLVLTVLHALVHVTIPVIPTGWTAAFATVSLYLLPVVGAGLAVSGYPRFGGGVLFVAGIAGFGFEGTFHFLINNPDHVAHVVDHRHLFGVTSILTTLGNLLLLVAAWISVRALSVTESQQSSLNRL